MTVATRERAKLRGELRSRSRDRLVKRQTAEKSRPGKRGRSSVQQRYGRQPYRRDPDRSIRELLRELKFAHYAMAKAVDRATSTAPYAARVRQLEAQLDRLLGFAEHASENASERLREGASR